MTATRDLHAGLLDRALGPRSVIASLLLGMHPPRLRTARIVEWCALFGIAPGTARVTLTRMVERGELRAADGVYELVGRVRERQRVQEWSLAPRLARWDGTWRIGVVTAERRPAATRAALRDAMRSLRHVELREGVWVRPDNLPAEAYPRAPRTVGEAQCAWWSGTPGPDALGPARDRFGVDDLADRGHELLERVHDVVPALGAGDHDRLAEGFYVGAAILQLVRADPLLPDDLLPARWPGTELRSEYARYQAVFAEAIAAWFRSRP